MFAGVFYREEQPRPAELCPALSSCLDRYAQADVSGSWQNQSFVLAQTLIHNAPESWLEQAPYRCPRSGIVVAAWARLDQRAELAAHLGQTRSLPELTDPMLILWAWQRWGTDCTTYLQGDFAVAIADPGRRELFLVRDSIGVRPLYYQLDSTQCRFSTTAAVFSRGGPWPAEPDPAWMARYLAASSQAANNRSACALLGVLKLEPGHSLHVTPERAELRRYHHFRDDAPWASRRERRWVGAYRSLLELVIQDQMRSSHALGTENSGGIDSATVTAFVARALGEPDRRLSSFSFALFEQEPAHILETSRAHRILHNHVYTSFPRRSDEIIDRALATLGFPEEHGNATGHVPFYQQCHSDGIRTLFSGFGGDEVVTNPGYHLRAELRDRGRYRTLWEIVPGSPLFRGLRWLKTMVKRRPGEYSPHLYDAMLSRWPFQLLKPEVVERLGLLEFYLSGARYDAPFRRINDFALDRLRAPYVAARLENCSLMAQSYGVEYRWPLLDSRLIQQYLSTPSIEKYGPRGVGRYLHRRAIDGVVPHRVAWKPSKDMGYAGAQDRMDESEQIALTREARRQEAHLHPAVEALIDRQKLKAQIDTFSHGSTDMAFNFAFKRSTESIRWLNHWLHGGPVD